MVVNKEVNMFTGRATKHLLASICLLAAAGFSTAASAWTVLYTNNDGQLETAYIQCTNGKQFPLSRWIYKNANKYQRLWVWDAGKSTSMGSNAVHLGHCNQSGHYDLGAKASYFCSCIGSN